MKEMRKDWWLGFASIFGFVGIQGLLTKDWLKSAWIIWFIWFIYFIPPKKKSKQKH